MHYKIQSKITTFAHTHRSRDKRKGRQPQNVKTQQLAGVQQRRDRGRDGLRFVVLKARLQHGRWRPAMRSGGRGHRGRGVGGGGWGGGQVSCSAFLIAV